jgi:hypothetical protein
MAEMNFVANTDAVDPDGVVSPDAFHADARAPLSGPGLRTFLNIAGLWGLSERERILALGSPARSTYHNWVSKAQAGHRISLPLDTLLRISAILGVHKDLRILFGDAQRGVQWLRAANAAPLFGGQCPLDLILSGAQAGIVDVRRFLDSWRGGRFAAPVDHPVEDSPWSDADIEIIDA